MTNHCYSTATYTTLVDDNDDIIIKSPQLGIESAYKQDPHSLEACKIDLLTASSAAAYYVARHYARLHCSLKPTSICLRALQLKAWT